MMKEQTRRSRLTVVCVNCKRRKIKCDKQSPCSACQKSNRSESCVYLFDPTCHTLPYALSAMRPMDLDTGTRRIRGAECLEQCQNHGEWCGCKGCISMRLPPPVSPHRPPVNNVAHSYIGRNTPQVQEICAASYRDSRHGFCSNRTLRDNCGPWKFLHDYLEERREYLSTNRFAHISMDGPRNVSEYTADAMARPKSILLDNHDSIVDLVRGFDSLNSFSSILQAGKAQSLQNLVRIRMLDRSIEELSNHDKSVLGAYLLAMKISVSMQPRENLSLTPEQETKIELYYAYASLCYRLIDDAEKENEHSKRLSFLLMAYYYIGDDVDFASTPTIEVEISYSCNLVENSQARDFLVMDRIFSKLVFNSSSKECRIPISNLSSEWNWKQRLYQLTFSLEDTGCNYVESLNKLEQDFIAIKPESLVTFVDWNLYMLAALFLLTVHLTVFIRSQKIDSDLSFSYLKSSSLLILHSVGVLESFPYVASSSLYAFLTDRLCKISISHLIAFNSSLIHSDHHTYNHCRSLFYLKTYWSDFFNDMFARLHASSLARLCAWKSYNTLLLCYHVVMDKSFYDAIHSRPHAYIAIALNDHQISQFNDLLGSSSFSAVSRNESLVNYSYSLDNPRYLGLVESSTTRTSKMHLPLFDLIHELR